MHDYIENDNWIMAWIFDHIAILTAEFSLFAASIYHCDAVSPMPVPHHDAMPALSGVRAAFFTARRNAYEADFDCTLGSPASAKNLANRALIAKTFAVAADRLLTTRQIEPDVIIIAHGWNIRRRPPHHAIVMKGNFEHVIGVLTSDCAPVLFADTKNPIVGAAHIGWREAAHNLLEKTIDAMEMLGAKRENIVTSIGPCAGVGDTYTVGADFARLAPNTDAAIHRFMVLSGDKNVFRFQDYIAHRLEQNSIAQSHILRTRIDTITDPGCFSRRRNGPGKGAMFSGIKLVKPAWG